MDPNAVAVVQALGALAFLALLLRLALLLGATPVGIMRQEILYLRGDVFRPIVRLVLALLVLEAAQLLLPFLTTYNIVAASAAAFAAFFIDLGQAVLLAVVALGTLRAFGPYSRRSLGELEVVARRSVEVIARRLPQAPRPGRRRGA